METVRVNLGPRSYDVAVTHGDAGGVGAFVRRIVPKTEPVFVVTDERVAPHAEGVAASLRSAGFRTAVTALPAGEETKSLFWLSRLYDDLASIPADRQTPVVA